MVTRTITLDLDAYEKLERAKRGSGESYSAVIRRGDWPAQPLNARTLLGLMTERMERRTGIVSEAVLDRLDEAQRSPRISDTTW